MPAILDDIRDRQLLFELEIMPNGGDSMKDAVSRIDNAVQFSGARWRAIIDRDEVATYECDLDGLCTQSNRAMCDLFGLEREEMMGVGWMKGLIPEDRERVYDAWMASVNKGIPYECSYTVRHADTGTEVEVTTIADPMENDRGHIIGFHGSITPRPFRGTQLVLPL